MSDEAPAKKIPIRNKKSNQVRYASPVPSHVERQVESKEVLQPPVAPGGPDSAMQVPSEVAPSSAAPEIDEVSMANASAPVSSANPVPPADIPMVVQPSQSPGTNPSSVQPEAKLAVEGEGGAEVGKRKPPPVTMEAFITQAFSRKGQRIGMNPRLEKSLSTHHKLDDAAKLRLMGLADADKLLVTPRQLLLAALSIESHPVPKKVLVEFVQSVMLRYSVYASGACSQALDLASISAVNVYGVFQSILGFRPPHKAGDEAPDASEVEQLRLNAVKLMTVWLFHAKNVRIEDLFGALLQTVWKPAANELDSDVQRIRALTELSEPAAMGWVAERYLRVAADAQDSEERIRNEAVALRAELNGVRSELAVTTALATALQAELDQVRQASADTVNALERSNQQTRTHLSYDIELMRGRLIESLSQNVERLQTGLAAISRDAPLIDVMVERAELVIESLRAELEELKEEG
jgi:hypothetical protein